MNSIPRYYYVVNSFTISSSQSKYRLFCISFTIAISILLLVVSQTILFLFSFTDILKQSEYGSNSANKPDSKLKFLEEFGVNKNKLEAIRNIKLKNI